MPGPDARAAAAAARRAVAPQIAVEAESWEGVDRDLFERLRALRLRVARERGVPPYVIFHDTTLRELARIKPTSLDGAQQVYGIGARKAEQLGEVFVAAIASFVDNP